MAAERPLLVSGPLIGPILRGEKTNTRRLPSFTLADIWIEGTGWTRGDPNICDQIGPIRDTDRVWGWGKDGRIHATAKAPCAVGDTLYVRETWRSVGWRPENGHWIEYAADNKKVWREAPADVLSMDVADHQHPDRWRPSIHMPRWAARIFLRVESVTVERVQDITEEEVRREGVGPCGPGCPGPYGQVGALRCAFARLWDSLAPDGSKWADNPWVWVIRFKLEVPVGR